MIGAIVVGGLVGAASAWWLHRRSGLSAVNVYVLAPVGVATFVGALATLRGSLVVATGPLAAAGVVGAVVARRLRLAALGAGGELREFEQAREMLWTALATGARGRRREVRERGDRTYIAGQGELVRQRGWPAEEPHLPMSSDGRGRVPRRAGRHVLIVGATGSGKTVSARRWLLARVTGDGVGVLVCDPKGDHGLERDLRTVARVVGRPFVVFDPRDPDTDRWNPLWSDDVGAVVSRLVAPIAAGEGNARYYADLLQIHLGTVASGLRAAGLWPANLPLLLDAAQLGRYDRLLGAVRDRHGPQAEITRQPAGAPRHDHHAGGPPRPHRRHAAAARDRWRNVANRPHPRSQSRSATRGSSPRAPRRRGRRLDRTSSFRRRSARCAMRLAIRWSTTTRTIDVLLATAGINDAGFGDILKQCATSTDCQQGGDMSQVAPRYEDLDAAISANLKVGGIYFAGYPERLFTDGDDHYHACGAFTLMNNSDAQWATGIGHQLNGILAAEAGLNGWTVRSTVDEFRGHGYCASSPIEPPPSPLPSEWHQTYFRAFSQSLIGQSDKEGTAHPNHRGHKAIVRVMLPAVRTDTPPPPTQRLTLRFLRVRVVDLGRDPNVRGSDALPWDGRVTFGMAWYRNTCGSHGATVIGLSALPDFPAGTEDGWTDISDRPCLSFPITTVGRSFQVGASATLGKISYADVQLRPGQHARHPLHRSYTPLHLHHRSDPWVQTGPAGLLRSVYRQHSAHGYGSLDIEYEITSQLVVGP
jgi:hypothetical protein